MNDRHTIEDTLLNPEVIDKEVENGATCPFCGRTPTKIKNCNNVPIGLRCLNCSLDMVCEDYQARWNRRASE